jgi:hypothetical protein
LNEQEKNQRSRKIQTFMKCAICVRPGVKKIENDWLTDFIQCPRFLKPEFLPSGRATPETAARWKIEDDLLRKKGDRGWKTVEEGRARRRKTGHELFEKVRSGNWIAPKNEISYLTVSCDGLPEEPPVLPKRVREKSPERGNYFCPPEQQAILGPKTEEEAAEDLRLDTLMEQEWIRWSPSIQALRSCCSKNKQERGWTPRWPDDEIDSKLCIRVRVVSAIPDTYLPDME